MPAIYRETFVIPANAIDRNGHVNNVAYVQWMQDIAVRHSDAQGGTLERYGELGVTWVVRSHFVEYLAPALAGEEIEVVTWVADMRRTGSKRKYRFRRLADDKLLARAETDWIMVSSTSGRPCGIRPEVAEMFEVVPPAEEP